MTTDKAREGLVKHLTRPLISLENRTPQEVFDIMCDRVRHTLRTAQPNAAEPGHE